MKPSFRLLKDRFMTDRFPGAAPAVYLIPDQFGCEGNDDCAYPGGGYVVNIEMSKHSTRERRRWLV